MRTGASSGPAGKVGWENCAGSLFKDPAENQKSYSIKIKQHYAW
jgi:hypothetical protein